MTLSRAATRGEITIRDIQVATCCVFSVPMDKLKASRRWVPLVRIRHLSVGLAHELTEASGPEIARHFGYRNHTSVLHACRRYQALVAEDAAFRSDRALVLRAIPTAAEARRIEIAAIRRSLEERGIYVG